MALITTSQAVPVTATAAPAACAPDCRPELTQLLELTIKSTSRRDAQPGPAVLVDAAGQAAAVWPPGSEPTEALLAAARLATRSDRPLAAGGEGGSAMLAAPLETTGTSAAAIAITTTATAKERVAMLDRLRVAAQWAGALTRLSEVGAGSGATADAAATLAAMGNPDPHKRSAALVDHIAAASGCRRIALAVKRWHGVEIAAVSGDKSYPARSPLMAELRNAARLVLGHPHAGRDGAVRADGECRTVLPLLADNRTVAALIADSDPAAEASAEAAMARIALASALGPLVALHLGAARDPGGMVRRALDRIAVSGRGGRLLGALCALLFLCLPAPHTIRSEAEVEGEHQRVMVAPMDTYIDAVYVTAGDRVEAGTPLVEFHTDDLVMTRVKWASERAGARSARRDAAARQDRAKLQVLAAQIEHADAELELVGHQIERRQLRAPIDGIVVSGDLSQRLGAPVKRGEALFEIIPAGGYRLRILVAEPDIAVVAAGQRGTLKLNAFPDTNLGFSIERVTPLAAATPAGNHFIAYARLDQVAPELRPGMAGIARIHTGEQARIRSWTRDLRAWLSLQWWRWFG